MIKQICLDVDGVLVDWCGAVCRLFGEDPQDVYDRWDFDGDPDITVPLGITTEELWKMVNASGPEFWSGLQPYPWADALWDLCNKLAPTSLLTATSEDPHSASGKMMWMQNRWGVKFRDFLIGSQKQFCARPGAILVDDQDKNCEKFVMEEDGTPTGASAVLFPQPWNSLSCFQGDPFDFVKQSLIMKQRGCL